MVNYTLSLFETDTEIHCSHTFRRQTQYNWYRHWGLGTLKSSDIQPLDTMTFTFEVRSLICDEVPSPFPLTNHTEPEMINRFDAASKISEQVFEVLFSNRIMSSEFAVALFHERRGLTQINTAWAAVHGIETEQRSIDGIANEGLTRFGPFCRRLTPAIPLWRQKIGRKKAAFEANEIFDDVVFQEIDGQLELHRAILIPFRANLRNNIWTADRGVEGHKFGLLICFNLTVKLRVGSELRALWNRLPTEEEHQETRRLRELSVVQSEYNAQFLEGQFMSLEMAIQDLLDGAAEQISLGSRR